jgi:hypothetical protein
MDQLLVCKMVAQEKAGIYRTASPGWADMIGYKRIEAYRTYNNRKINKLSLNPYR